jgi:basic amino acid/polyamine antiporter, APA family
MKPLPPAKTTPGLVRALGPLMATAVVVGTVIGTGVFKKPQTVAENVPYFGLTALVWVGTGLLALLGALSYAEVCVLLPRAGGNYVFLREAYGRLAGFLWGWVEFWIIRSASIAALATIFAESLHDILKNAAFREALGLPAGSGFDFWTQQWVTVAVLAGLAGINVLGVRWGALVQLFVTLIKVGSLVAIAVLPFLIVGAGEAGPRVERLRPTWPTSWSEVPIAGMGTAFLGVLWAYHGWMNVAPVAEEVRRPQRNLPLALLAGVVILIALYLGANLAYSLVLSRQEMAGLKSTTVATEFSLRLLGPLGAAAASAAVMCSTFGALNGNLLVGPRLLYAMGEDGLAPRALHAVSPRFHTPVWAIVTLAAWSAVLVLGGAALTHWRLPVLNVRGWELDLNVPEGKPLFDVLTDLAMFGAVIFETLAVESIFVFRRKWPDAPRSYRCLGYPLTPALYVLLPLFILSNMVMRQRLEVLSGVGFIALGVAVYLALGLGRSRKEPGSAHG